MRHGYEVFHQDVRVPAHFYVTVLGFTPDDEPCAADTDYTTVHRGSLTIGCSRYPEADPTPRKPPRGSEIVLHVDDVDIEYDRVQANGWPVEDPLQVRPWGMTDFRVFDPTGQYIRVTGPHEDNGASS